MKGCWAFSYIFSCYGVVYHTVDKENQLIAFLSLVWSTVDPARHHLSTPIRPWATRNPPPPWVFFTVVIFKASEYGPIEIRLFALKLLGLNMLKYAN